MTNTTSTPDLSTVASVLALHGFANIDDAREANVSFGCHGCGSIAQVTATNEVERIAQRDLIDWSCCPDSDDFVL